MPDARRHRAEEQLVELATAAGVVALAFAVVMLREPSVAWFLAGAGTTYILREVAERAVQWVVER